MTPAPQETMVPGKTEPLKRPLPGEEVVISGMSGIFPGSDNIPEFMENLYNKVDMVTSEDPRWVFNHPEVPKHLGKVNGMSKFDAQFFRVHYKQACTMEPMSRKLLEHAYGAIYDSGINPEQLRGKKVGVFIGSTFSESEKVLIYENIQRNGFAITGCNKAMYANRISYWIDGKGPSYALDLACASSSACLEHAYRSISSGQCDAAIVGGCNLCMDPKVSLNCRRSGFLCLDGKTRCFDKNGDGYVRADAISVLFLQRAKDAKRIYSEVYHAKASYSPASKQLLPVRRSKDIQQFLEAFYSEIDVSPNEVEYVEANGAATPEADINELQAIAEIFAMNKTIKIGSVKSNMGSSESASGICGISKMCLAYHNGKLPGNLHYNDPLDIPEVHDKIQVLTDNEAFGRGFAALNSFSYSGANVHVLMKGYYKQKDNQRYKSSIPYLVLVSGRNDNCVEMILGNLKKNPIDPEQISLLYNIHKYDIPGHMSRGYSLLNACKNNETVCLSQSVEYCPGITRPVWFVYSGMGSQWATMGTQLMKIPIFAVAIEKCHKVLEPRGVDIVRILTDSDKTIYDNILHSFVGIAAVQIGLTDILKEIGVVPDHIIGHSVGELGCAYADGCFTAEEMILSAYSRGLVSVQTPFIRGSMAAVGLGYKTVLAMCPPEIEVACHNSAESSTVSGPSDIMKQFVAELTSQGIFAKEVPCSNIAYHSKYITEAGPGLLKYLSEVIKSPKLRSKKWVSTSVPQDKWDDPLAKYSSAEYHTNNLLNPVLFEETSKLIPSDAVVIEISPHGLLQAILKRSLAESIHVPLTRRGIANPVKFLLEAFGKLYQAGLNFKIDSLYPKIEYPVSTGTPFLSQYVGWEHSEDWPQAKYNNSNRVVATVRDFVMSVYDDDYKYFKGHVRDGYNVFPESAYLVLVWETLAMYKGVTNYKDFPILFENVHFHGEAVIKPEVPMKLQIMIFKGNHEFEITFEDFTIVSGFVSVFDPKDRVDRNLQHTKKNSDTVFISSNDIYTRMFMKGYNYMDEFQSIYSSTPNGNKASIKWTDNWITYLDSLLQLSAFANDCNGVSVPSFIQQLCIDIENHKKAKLVNLDNVTCINADVYDMYKQINSGGLEISGLRFNVKNVIEQNPDVLLTQVFVPHFSTGVVPMKTALQVNLQIISENVSGNRVLMINLISSNAKDFSKAIPEVSAEIPFHEFINIKPIDDNYNESLGNSDFIVIDDMFTDEKKMREIYKIIPQNTFILTLEQNTVLIRPHKKLFNVITQFTLEKQVLMMLRKIDKAADEHITYMPIVHDQKFSWISRLQAEIMMSRKIVLVSERQHYCGLLGLVKKLKQENNNTIRVVLVIVDDFSVPTFNSDKDIFKEQLKKKLTINILKKGQWGGYYNVSSKPNKQLKNLYLTSTELGNLDALSWVEKPLLPLSNNLVQVCYAGMSINDAKIAAGKINLTEQAFGMDFSGIDIREEKVMGVVSGGAIGSTVVADPELLWPVPAHWTLEDAATVPLAYTHAYYCLTIRTTLRRGLRVLINGGATGALGQAIINICLYMNCDIYIAGCDAKQKKFLLLMFPGLQAENIANTPLSLLHKIVDDVQNSTSSMLDWQEQRCDIIINCLSGSRRKAAMKCGGRLTALLDVCDYDMTKNEAFGMGYLYQEKTYKSVNLNTIFLPEYAQEKKLIQLRIAAGIAKGIVRPLSRVIYSPNNVTQAFRLLCADKHRGQVLIKMNNLDSINQSINITARMSYCPKGTYVVVSDKTSLSIELADRLVKGGAMNLVIHMKPNPGIPDYCPTMAWKKHDVTLKKSSENLQTENGCVNLLKEGAKLGPVRGIFIVNNFNGGESSGLEAVGEKFDNKVRVIANLDLISRNICNDLDHFVVLNLSTPDVSDEYVSSVTDNICRARNEIGLPALVFRAGQIKELDGFEADYPKLQPQPLSAMLNALETSLEQKQNNVVTYNLKKNPGFEFLQRVSRIIGVNINKIDENLCLKDLVFDEIGIEEIHTAIKNTQQKSYPTAKLRRLTVADLKKLGCHMSDTAKDGDSSGLSAFFTYIDQDECLASEPVIAMATSCSSILEEEELDPKASYLILVPGFEGHHRIFTTVSERLKIQALTFQLVPDMPSDSIPQIAADIARLTRKRLELTSKFYLLGYSFGVNVALELAKIFENEGHVGIVYCLDSSPDALRVQLDAYIGNLTDAQLQNAIVEHMYKLMSGRQSTELKQELQTKENWNDKVELCVNKLRGLVNYSHQYKRCLLNSAYRRIILAREYQPEFKLESELVLIKGIPHPNMAKLTDDFNLFKYTKKPVKIVDIEFDHASAHQDCRVSNIVNRYLEPKLLDEFKNMNLCMTYLANPVKKW